MVKNISVLTFSYSVFSDAKFQESAPLCSFPGVTTYEKWSDTSKICHITFIDKPFQHGIDEMEAHCNYGAGVLAPDSIDSDSNMSFISMTETVPESQYSSST